MTLSSAAVAKSDQGLETRAVASAKKCGSFKATYRYTVSKSGPVKCSFALRIVKSFIRDHDRWRKRGDGTVAGTYYTNRRFRGWRCSEGSGGGSCSRGRRSAAYQTASA